MRNLQLSVTINSELLCFCITALSVIPLYSNTFCSCSTNQMRNQLTQLPRAHWRFSRFLSVTCRFIKEALTYFRFLSLV